MFGADRWALRLLSLNSRGHFDDRRSRAETQSRKEDLFIVFKNIRRLGALARGKRCRAETLR